MAAALVDQNELSSLRIEQSQLIALLKNKEGSLKQKIIRLAEILEKRILLLDPEFEGEEYRHFAVSQISTEITRMLKRHNVAIAPWVSEYLPDKYKDPSQSNNALSNRSASPSQWGGIDPVLLIEELTALPADETKRLATSTKINLYDTVMKLKNLLEGDARDKKYQLNDKVIREHIGSRKQTPRINEYGKAMIYLGETMIDFGLWATNVFPPPEEFPELEQRWAAGAMAHASMYENMMNEKYSLTDPLWLERDVYRIHQSKHGAAVKDKVDATLCKHCSILDREKYEPGDFVEMEWDRTSPTMWRCKVCNGTEHVKRPLTREQCGDKAILSCPKCEFHFDWEQGLSPIENRAIELSYGLQGWYDSQEYYQTVAQKCIAYRKVKLGVDLSSKA